MSEFPKIDIATQFHRNNAIPLDSTEIFDSLSTATDYAETNGTAYTGQIITVVENNSISAFQLTTDKKLDLVLTKTNTDNKFEEIFENFETIENLIADLSSETSADIYTINNKIKELSGIVNKNIDFIQAISVDLSDDISNIVEFNNKISIINKNLDDLSNKHKDDIEEVSKKITDISGEIDYIYSDLSEINSNIDNLSTKHNTEISELKLSIDDLSTTTTENINTNRELISKLSIDIDGNTTLIDELSSVLDDLSDVFSINNIELKEKITSLSGEHKDDIDKLLSRLEETDDIISELSGKHGLEIKILEKDISTLNEKFETFENELSNKVPEYETDPIFTKWKDECSAVIIGKDAYIENQEAGIAIGLNTASYLNGIAIGKNASAFGNNRIAIGVNTRSVSHKGLAIGNSSFAAENAIALGFDAKVQDAVENGTTKKSTNSIAIGQDAKVIGANNAVQIGSGLNTADGTLQFRNYPLVDNNGKIFEERIPDQISANINKLSNSINELSTSTFEAISKNTELINNLSGEIESSIDELNKEIDDISSQHKIDFENLLSKTEDLNNEIDSISSKFSNEISGINSSIINIFDELISNTNNINELSDSVSSLNIYIDELSDKFETFENELSVIVPDNETDPKFTEWKDECSSVIIGKDAKIDDSTNGIALGLSASSNQNSIAIGMNAKASGPNRIVIGMNSISEYKGTALGIGAASSGENSIAIGSDAKVYRNPNTDKEAGKGSIAIGISAIVDGAKNAVQLGKGTNTTDETLQFRDYPLVDTDGQIYKERLSNYVENYVNDKITEVKSVINETYDYTAFEAWLLKETLPVGSTVSSIYDDTIFTAKKEITAGTCQAVYLWTYKDATEFTNIVIDWGDGNIEELDKITTLSTDSTSAFISGQVITNDKYLDIFNILYPEIDGNVGSVKECFNQVPDFNYSVKYADGDGPTENYKKDKVLISDNATMYSILHKYKIPEDKGELRPIIKVYGSNYFAITTGNTMNLTSGAQRKSFIYELKEKVNRLSRCFDKDLPIASNVTCLNGFTGSDNQTLFEVMVPEYYNWNSNLKDITGLFKSKFNLQRVRSTGQAERGTGNLLAKSFGMISAKGIFSGSKQLSSFYIRLPNYIGRPVNLRSFFELDSVGSSLSMDVCDILPKEKFIDKEISVGELFKGCSNLSCSNEAKLSSYLWGDETVKWTNTEKAFEGCSDELRAMVPTTWGGTKTDWVSNRDKLLTNVDNMDITEIVSTLLQLI